jgi:hypothetical protein
MVPHKTFELSLSRLTLRGIAIRLFITCWIVYCLHFATNIAREIYPALSLGDHFSFDVSEYKGLHPDIFELPGRGTFINNNPGASILASIPYALFKPAINRIVDRVKEFRAGNKSSQSVEYRTDHPNDKEFYQKARERSLDIKFGLGAWVMQAFFMAPVSALSVVVMFRVLLGLALSLRKAIILSLLFAFATPVFYRAAILNQNALVCHFAFWAFALLWRPWDDPDRPRKPSYFIAGLLSGWTVVTDYSGVVAVMALSVYAIARRISLPHEIKGRSDLFLFLIGTGLSISVLLGYQWSSFGHPFYPAQSYMPKTDFSGFGYRGVDWPSLDLLFDTAFNIRFGLFVSTPLLLLSFYIPGWFRDIRLLKRRETWFVLAFAVMFFLFCGAIQYGRLQYLTGVRYIVPVTPFLFLIAAGVLLRLSPPIAVCVGIATTYWSWCLAMYRDVEFGFGVPESIFHISLEGFRLPWVTTLERMGYLNGASSVIALFILSGALILTLWSVHPSRTVKEPNLDAT